MASMDVEVIFPDICGAFYKGKLIDMDSDGGKCLVSFEEDWKPNSWVELKHVRFPPSPPKKDMELNTGTKIEAFLPFQEGEPCGWWLATVTKTKGEVAGIQFQSGDKHFTDLVERQSLRAPNENPPLEAIQFYQKEFTVPDDIQDYCQEAKVHNNFRSKVGAISVTYNTDKKSLVVICDNQASLEKAELLIDMHLSDMSTQASLRSKAEKAAQRLHGASQPVLENSSGLYEDKFHIFPECIGFAMGRQGWNVNQARQIPGIISIDFDDFGSVFTVRAETKEAAMEARSLLEFTRSIMHVPRDLAGKVIGRGGNVIQQILEKSRLNNIKVIGDEEAQERRINTKGEVPFELLGRKKAIENATLMLEYHLDHLREVNNILQDREQITQQLRDSGLDDTPTYFPRPNPPRGWSGGFGRGGGGGGNSGGGGRRGGRSGGRGGGRRRRPRQGRTSQDERQNEEEEEEEEREEGVPPQDQSDESESSNDEKQDEEREEEEAEQQKAESHSEEEKEPTDRRRRRGGGGGGGGGRRRYRGRGRGGSYRNRYTNNEEDTPIQSEDWAGPEETPPTDQATPTNST